MLSVSDFKFPVDVLRTRDFSARYCMRVTSSDFTDTRTAQRLTVQQVREVILLLNSADENVSRLIDASLQFMEIAGAMPPGFSLTIPAALAGVRVEIIRESNSELSQIVRDTKNKKGAA